MFASSSELHAQYTESGCMIEVKPSLPYKYYVWRENMG